MELLSERVRGVISIHEFYELQDIESENEALRSTINGLRALAYDYIQAYEKLALDDALLTGEQDAS